MEASFTTLGRGHNAPCLPVSREEWLAARRDPKLADLCARINATDDPNRQRELKSQLPVWTPRCGAFKEHHRAEVDAVCPLDRLMFDIDVKGQTEHILTVLTDYNNEKYIGPFLVDLVEESVRHGTHVRVQKPEGMSPAEAQQQFAALVQLPVDLSVKNVAGCIYLVPESFVRYESPLFYAPNVIDPETWKQQERPSAVEAKAVTASVDQVRDFPATYEGVAFTYVVDALCEQLGGVPAHGSRNNFIFSMACHLRYLCQDNPHWIRQVLPTYGEEPGRVWGTIQSACNRAQPTTMPTLVRRAIAVAQGRSSVEQVVKGEENPFNTPNPPAFPARPPRLIRLLVSNVHEMYKPAVSMQVFPALGIHLNGVEVRYVDNTRHELGGFMGILMARQSIGKGSVNQPIELIMEDIRERDAANRMQERAWKEECKRAKSNEKKPKRPEGLCVQYLMSNMTNAALVQRLIDADSAGGRCLFLKLDEIEQLSQIRATGGAKPSELIRLSFDRALYGQERVGHDSVSGTPPLRLNITASTTEAAGMSYLKPELVNGTLSRLSISTIIKPVEMRGIPNFGNYDERYKRLLKPFLRALDEAKGLIECRQAVEMAKQMLEENETLYELSSDEEFQVLSYRSVRMAYDRAMLLYISQGCRWTTEIELFCRWSMQYDLWCKLHFFGSEMHAQNSKQQACQRCRGPRNLLRSLPTRFEYAHFLAVYHAQGRTGDPRQLIHTWTNRGYVTLDEQSGEYVKTVDYLRKFEPDNLETN